MQRWKEEFVGHTHKKCVHVNHNGDFEHGKVLYMEPDWTLLDLLHAASQRLNMVSTAKRVFNADGIEVDDCMMIEDNDILFFSITDDFIPPTAHHDDSTDGSKGNRHESLQIPHMVGGYKVGELLGKGGFGEVRVGEHLLTGQKVALKFLRKSEIHSLGAAERTNTEIQCLATLKHLNIIRLQQHVETTNHVVLVFELMEGGDLLKYLKNVRTNKPPEAKGLLSEDEARHIFYQVLSAVSYAHNQHICHRDLKLENILLKDNTLSLVKIADFGLSDFYRPGALVKSNCGTLSFLAPEVFRGTANAGPPLDVWSLGVILFAILCGRLPFEGPDLNGTKRPRDAVIKTRIMKGHYKIEEQLGPEAKDLVRRMLQVDPAERATVPEIFNHIWMRTSTSGHGQLFAEFQLSSSNLLQSIGSSKTHSSISGALETPAGDKQEGGTLHVHFSELTLINRSQKENNHDSIGFDNDDGSVYSAGGEGMEKRDSFTTVATVETIGFSPTKGRRSHSHSGESLGSNAETMPADSPNTTGTHLPPTPDSRHPSRSHLPRLSQHSTQISLPHISHNAQIQAEDSFRGGSISAHSSSDRLSSMADGDDPHPSPLLHFHQNEDGEMFEGESESSRTTLSATPVSNAFKLVPLRRAQSHQASHMEGEFNSEKTHTDGVGYSYKPTRRPSTVTIGIHPKNGEYQEETGFHNRGIESVDTESVTTPIGTKPSSSRISPLSQRKKNSSTVGITSSVQQQQSIQSSSATKSKRRHRGQTSSSANRELAGYRESTRSSTTSTSKHTSRQFDSYRNINFTVESSSGYSSTLSHGPTNPLPSPRSSFEETSKLDLTFSPARLTARKEPISPRGPRGTTNSPSPSLPRDRINSYGGPIGPPLMSSTPPPPRSHSITASSGKSGKYGPSFESTGGNVVTGRIRADSNPSATHTGLRAFDIK